MLRNLVSSVRKITSSAPRLREVTTTTNIANDNWAASRKRKYKTMATLETLNFDNVALRSLPIDKEKQNYTRQVEGACFSRVNPTPVDNPVLVAVSHDAMGLLDLQETEIERKELPQYFSGSLILKGSEPAAHCYCGHQFGHFSGQLGDGAAMYLGEVVNKAGERWEIQLKGAGLTPYSRTADGRKVLRSTIREFLCSEAMFYLGVPTTRAGTCVTSDSTVIRDIYYSGNPIAERCSVVLRIAPTFIRFGSFEIFKGTDEITGRKGPSHGRTDILIQLLDYTISTIYPEIWRAYGSDKPKVYEEFFREVVKRTARLVAHWQTVGFCHGVLNTDNMSIAGVTIDYGPYGFMDAFDPNYICNGSDDGGRYTYEKQPEICQWNCLKLAEAIQEAVPLSDTKPHVDSFMEEFDKHYIYLTRRKFGLFKEKETDIDLVKAFLETLQKTGADFTNCFRCLSSLPLPGSPHWDEKHSEILNYLLSQCSTVAELRMAVSKPKMNPRQFQMFMMILQSNPELLNQLGGAQRTIMQELNRMEKAKELESLTEEGHLESNQRLWREWLVLYTDRLKEEADHQTDLLSLNTKRIELMNQANPRVILRNYIAQNAIMAAEKGDYSEVRRVLKVLENPFIEGSSQERNMVEQSVDSDQTSAAASFSRIDSAGGTALDSVVDAIESFTSNYDSKPPLWSRELCVT